MEIETGLRITKGEKSSGLTLNDAGNGHLCSYIINAHNTPTEYENGSHKKLRRRNFHTFLFPECVARVPVSLGGLGVRLCSPKVAFATATVGNRSQPSATVCGDAVRLSTVASASEGVQKLCQIESRRRSFIGVCTGRVCESDLWRRSFIGVWRGGVCESDLWRGSYNSVCRGGVCENDLWRRSYIGLCRGGVCASDLRRRSYFGVCRGGVCASDLCRRSYIGVCRGGLCESDLCRRSYIGVRRGGLCESDLSRGRYIGVCTGRVCENDL